MILVWTNHPCLRVGHHIYDLCIQGSSSFPLEVGSNYKFSRYLVLPRNEFQQQLSTSKDHNSQTVDPMTMG
jgi:hypothetical protein